MFKRKVIEIWYWLQKRRGLFNSTQLDITKYEFSGTYFEIDKCNQISMLKYNWL